MGHVMRHKFIPDHMGRSELFYGEHLLLWAFRLLALGGEDCGIARNRFESACGIAGPEALCALTVFVHELKIRGTRRVALNAPGCRLTTPDEKTILSLFAAAQAENHPRLETLLADLLGQPPQPPFAAAASLIAQTFEMNGLILRGPTP